MSRPTNPTPEARDALDERDERVATVLRVTIRNNREAARDLREQAAALEREACDIEAAAAAETWHKLGPYLTAADVESLCQASPSGLLSDEDV
jgi:hypothetical protein